jgi:hypothetical protein
MDAVVNNYFGLPQKPRAAYDADHCWHTRPVLSQLKANRSSCASAIVVTASSNVINELRRNATIALCDAIVAVLPLPCALLRALLRVFCALLHTGCFCFTICWGTVHDVSFVAKLLV